MASKQTAPREQQEKAMKTKFAVLTEAEVNEVLEKGGKILRFEEAIPIADNDPSYVVLYRENFYFSPEDFEEYRIYKYRIYKNDSYDPCGSVQALNVDGALKSYFAAQHIERYERKEYYARRKVMFGIEPLGTYGDTLARIPAFTSEEAISIYIRSLPVGASGTTGDAANFAANLE